MVSVSLERFERDDRLLRFLRHEFMHLHDMVDPAFAYSPQLDLRTHNPTQHRITRERYRLLWDVTIDGRLARAGCDTMTTRERHQALFDRAFCFWSEEKRRQAFTAHWEDDAPRHENLLAVAADPRDVTHAHEPLPGGLCPLCGFPTFEWANVPALNPETLSLLRAQFPDWMPAQGACKRCVEIYEIAGKFEAPPTMVL